ncbi:MAG: DMT family transporter [Devosia sp.]
MDSKSNWLALGMAALTVVLWSASYPWSQAVLSWLHPIPAAEARYGLAAVVLIALTIGSGKLIPVFLGNWKSYATIGVIGFAIYPMLLFTALIYTSSMNVAVIMALSPVLTMVGAAVFLGEKMPTRAMIGLGISVLGAVVAVLGDNPKGLAGVTLDFGEPLALVAAFGLAFYTVGSRKFLSKDVPPMVNTALLLTVGAVCLLPITLIFGKAPTHAPSLEVIGSLAAIVLGSTVLGYVLWLKSIQMIGVDKPNLLFNFIPVLTMIYAWIGGTAPYPEQMVGAALVLIGVTVAAWKGKAAHSTGHA